MDHWYHAVWLFLCSDPSKDRVKDSLILRDKLVPSLVAWSSYSLQVTHFPAVRTPTVHLLRLSDRSIPLACLYSPTLLSWLAFFQTPPPVGAVHAYAMRWCHLGPELLLSSFLVWVLYTPSEHTKGHFFSFRLFWLFLGLPPLFLYYFPHSSS